MMGSEQLNLLPHIGHVGHVGHVAEVLVAEVISALLERGSNLLEQGNNYRQAEQIYESLKAWVGPI